jgi:hypothetical protein
MRVMVMVKASQASEAGAMPEGELLAAMGKFNEELVKAGVMLAGEGLHPSRKGVRVHYSGSQRSVVDGPFAETQELVAGFWLWQVRSMDEAIEGARRCPNPHAEDCEVEIRPVFEADDFCEAFMPELREQEDRLRAEVEARRNWSRDGWHVTCTRRSMPSGASWQPGSSARWRAWCAMSAWPMKWRRSRPCSATN